MSRVIKIEKELELKTKHKDCGAKIGYYPNEVKSYVYEDYGGGSEVVYYIDCPNCGKKVEVAGR
jgi:hypothetical protein